MSVSLFLTAIIWTTIIKYHEERGTLLQSHEESKPPAAAQGKQEMCSQILTELLSSFSKGKT
jgi:hypothetical protein